MKAFVGISPMGNNRLYLIKVFTGQGSLMESIYNMCYLIINEELPAAAESSLTILLTNSINEIQITF